MRILLQRAALPQVERLLLIPRGGETWVREEVDGSLRDFGEPIPFVRRKELVDLLRDGVGLPEGVQTEVVEGDREAGSWTAKIEGGGEGWGDICGGFLLHALRGVSGITFTLQRRIRGLADHQGAVLSLDLSERAALEAAVAVPGGLVLVTAPSGRGRVSLRQLARMLSPRAPLAFFVPVPGTSAIPGTVDLSGVDWWYGSTSSWAQAFSLQPDLMLIERPLDERDLDQVMDGALFGTGVVLVVELAGGGCEPADWFRLRTLTPRLGRVLSAIVHVQAISLPCGDCSGPVAEADSGAERLACSACLGTRTLGQVEVQAVTLPDGRFREWMEASGEFQDTRGVLEEVLAPGRARLEARASNCQELRGKTP